MHIGAPVRCAAKNFTNGRVDPAQALPASYRRGGNRNSCATPAKTFSLRYFRFPPGERILFAIPSPASVGRVFIISENCIPCLYTLCIRFYYTVYYQNPFPTQNYRPASVHCEPPSSPLVTRTVPSCRRKIASNGSPVWAV